jgi:hypothetical protein
MSDLSETQDLMLEWKARAEKAEAELDACNRSHQRKNVLLNDAEEAAEKAEADLQSARDAFLWLYQYAGATGASVEILDNLSALGRGEPAPHEWVYPAMSPEHEKVLADNAALREALRSCDLVAAIANRVSRDIWLNERLLEISATAAKLLASPNPGAKLLAVVNAAQEETRVENEPCTNNRDSDYRDLTDARNRRREAVRALGDNFSGKAGDAK